MAENKQFWSRKTFCIVTGASQGIGRQISYDFSKNVGEGSIFLLLARNINNLNETKAQIESVNNNINVYVAAVDLNEPSNIDFDEIIKKTLVHFNSQVEDFDCVIAVHNAGSLGDVSQFISEMNNVIQWQDYFTLNLFSVSLLNAAFLKVFNNNNLNKKPEICMINITSLCGIQPFASMGYYCIGKASREMFFRVLAAENPDYYVLNYSPGPVLTDMTSAIINNIKNPTVKDMFIDMTAKDTIVKCPQSVAKLVQVLESRKVESGARFDYFDSIPA